MKTNKIFSVAMVAVAMMAMTMTSCSKDDDATTGITTTTVAQTKGMGGKLTICLPIGSQMVDNLDMQVVVTDASGNATTTDVKPGVLKTYDEVKNIENPTSLYLSDMGKRGSNVKYFVKEVNVSATPANYKFRVTGTKKTSVQKDVIMNFLFATPIVTFTQNGVLHADMFNNCARTIENVEYDFINDNLNNFEVSNRNITISDAGEIKASAVK